MVGVACGALGHREQVRREGRGRHDLLRRRTAVPVTIDARKKRRERRRELVVQLHGGDFRACLQFHDVLSIGLLVIVVRIGVDGHEDGAHGRV